MTSARPANALFPFVGLSSLFSISGKSSRDLLRIGIEFFSQANHFRLVRQLFAELQATRASRASSQELHKSRGSYKVNT